MSKVRVAVEGSGDAIEVETYEGFVHIDYLSEKHEDGRNIEARVSSTLTPEEARSLAAVLCHFANEAAS